MLHVYVLWRAFGYSRAACFCACLHLLFWSVPAPAQPELVEEVSQMLDPDLHQEHAAAASKQGGAGSSSSPTDVPFSDGLVQDTITLLQMLHEAQALADSPLQLALQVCWEH